MADWRMTGTYYKSCSCDPGCGCNFRGIPSSPEGNCEALICHVIEEGRSGDVDLSGSRVAWALWWPGAIHERGDQKNALGQILMGQAGGVWFEVIASIVSDVKEPAVVPIELEISGKRGKVRLGDKVENDFGPIKSPIDDSEFAVQVTVPGGMEYSDEGTADILQSTVLRSSDEIGFDRPGSHVSLVENQTFGSHR